MNNSSSEPFNLFLQNMKDYLESQLNVMDNKVDEALRGCEPQQDVSTAQPDTSTQQDSTTAIPETTPQQDTSTPFPETTPRPDVTLVSTCLDLRRATIFDRLIKNTDWKEFDLAVARVQITL